MSGLSLDDPWRTLEPWTPVDGARSVRHALANAVLPLTVALDLLPDPGDSPEVLDLLRCGVASLQDQVRLLDVCTATRLEAHLTDVSSGVALLGLDPGLSVQVCVPQELHWVLSLMPVSFTGQLSGTSVVAASPGHPGFELLFSHPSPAKPFASRDSGLLVPALVRCVDAAGGQVAVNAAGSVRVSIPCV